MATSFSGPDWTLDATDIGALPRTILGAQNRFGNCGMPETVTQAIAIGEITWHATNSVADDAVVMTDLAGNEVVRLGPATGGDFEDQIKYPDTFLVVGLIVTSLPHGIVHVYFR